MRWTGIPGFQPREDVNSVLMDQAKESTESTGQNQTIVHENMDAQKAYEESVGTWSHITNSEIADPVDPATVAFIEPVKWVAMDNMI